MPLRIAIIGAGITGLVTGVLLRQKGMNVEIIEKREAALPIGGGLGIWPNGTKTLLNLPCAPKLHFAGTPLQHAYFTDATGNTLMSYSGELFRHINGYPILNFCRSELHKILLEEFGAHLIKFATQCTSLKSTHNKVQATFNHSELQEFDLLIGADGVHSSVRRMIFPNAATQYAGYIQLVGIYQTTSHTLSRPLFIWGQNRHCLTIPITQNRHALYIVRPYEQGRLLEHQQDRTQEISLFRGWSAKVDHALNCFEDSLKNPTFEGHYFCGEAFIATHLPPWQKEHVVLLGDAAHPIGSIFGLGASTALEDCQHFVDCISESDDLQQALHRYEVQQKPRASAFLQEEKEITNFLLNADALQHQKFTQELKETSAEVYLRSFMNLLKHPLGTTNKDFANTASLDTALKSAEKTKTSFQLQHATLPCEK